MGTPSRQFALPHPFVPQPLPSLSTRPIPKAPYARDVEFSQQRQSDIAAMNFCVKSMREATSDRLHSVAQVLAEIDENKRGLEEAIKEIGEKAKNMSKVLKKQREEAELVREREKEVAGRQRELRAKVDTVKSDIAEVEAKLAARRACESFVLCERTRADALLLLLVSER